MTRRLGVAVVGCGQIAPRHFAAIAETEGLELRAVCDIDPAKRHIWAGKLGVPALSDVDEILARENIDLVSICTPNYLHAAMAWSALDAGKHAVVEKPLALSSADALNLGRAFQKAGLALFSVLQVRYNTAVQAAVEAVRGGALGRLYVASMIQRWNRHPHYFEGDNNWHGKKDLEGGALFTQGIHDIDLLLQLAGPIAEVSAHTATLAHKIETEDAAVAHVTFCSGAVGVIEFGLDTYRRNLEASITVLGERGNIELGGTAANEIAFWDVESKERPKGLAASTPNDYGGAYVGSPPNHGDVYRNIVAHLTHGEAIAVTAESAAESIRVVEAIYESEKIRKTIIIACLCRDCRSEAAPGSQTKTVNQDLASRGGGEAQVA